MIDEDLLDIIIPAYIIWAMIGILLIMWFNIWGWALGTIIGCWAMFVWGWFYT